MTEQQTPENKPRPGEQEKGSHKRAALVVLIVAVAVVGTLLLLNKDRLLVYSAILRPTTPVDTPTEPSNQPPLINELRAQTDRIEPFSICTLECEAVDPDDDPLTYTWNVSAGDIFGDGPSVDWGSPVSEGLYRVSVTVDDGRGGTAQFSIPLHVQANVPPAFSGMIMDSDWVRGGNSVRVACQVSDEDGDEITLQWKATGGSILGSGSAIIWTAPEEDGVYWITVDATDSYGGEARRSLPVSVSSGEPPKIDGLFLHGVNTEMLRRSATTG